MNYVPLEFLDSVASTLRDLPFKAKLCTTHEEFVLWSEAINNARAKRVVYTMQITETNDTSNLYICFLSSAGSRKKLNLQDFLKLDRNCTQIHQIMVNIYEGYFDSFNSKIELSLEFEFNEIVDAIKPLANWTSLLITSTESIHKRGFNYLSLLGQIDFSEIIPTKRTWALCPNFDAEFMMKQMASGTLNKVSIWPQLYSDKFALEVEKFLVSQLYSKVVLPKIHNCDSQLLERLLESQCGSEKDIFLYCSDCKEDFVRKREDGVQVTFEVLVRHDHFCLLSFKRG